MSLIVTDEARRRKLKRWWFRATMSDDPVSAEPGLDPPPIPVQLYGSEFRSETECVVGCFDFNPPADVGITVNVYRSEVSGGPYTLVGSFDPTLNSQITDTGLDPETDYFYVLRSLGDGITYLAQESGNSAEIPAPAP